MRSAPHACSGRRASVKLRPSLQALGIRRRISHIAHRTQGSTNQGATSASRPETVGVLLRPVQPRRSAGPTGVRPQGGRCPNPGYYAGSSRPRTYRRDPSYRFCCHWSMLISMSLGSGPLFIVVRRSSDNCYACEATPAATASVRRGLKRTQTHVTFTTLVNATHYVN